MKITICGSIAFYDEMRDIKKRLENLGHQVKLPPFEIKDEAGNMIPVKQYYEIRKVASDDTGWIWERKKEAMKKHFDKVVWADAILVTNYDKKGVVGYVGSNTLMEMGLAFHLDKPIYLLNAIPEIGCKEEILGMQAVILNGKLEEI